MLSWLKSNVKDIADKKGKELSHAARWNSTNRFEIIKDLLESKADVNHVESGHTVLYWCCASANDIPIIKYLIEHKADVNHGDSLGFTALKRAVLVRNAEVVKVLLEHKADPNQKGKNDETPLLTAAEYANETIVNLLIEYKASPWEDTGQGTAYDYAMFRLGHSKNESDKAIKRRQGTCFALSLEGLSYFEAMRKYKQDLQDYEKIVQTYCFDALLNFPTALIHIILLPYLKPVEPKDPRVLAQEVETSEKRTIKF